MQLDNKVVVGLVGLAIVQKELIVFINCAARDQC